MTQGWALVKKEAILSLIEATQKHCL